MSILSAVDSRTGIYIHKLSGNLTRDEVLNAQKGVYLDDGFDPATPVLWDARDVSINRVVTFNEMAQLAKSAAQFSWRMAGGKSAILTASAVYYGMARMYETLATSFPRQISVFREYEEAVNWLVG